MCLINKSLVYKVRLVISSDKPLPLYSCQFITQKVHVIFFLLYIFQESGLIIHHNGLITVEVFKREMACEQPLVPPNTRRVCKLDIQMNQPLFYTNNHQNQRNLNEYFEKSFPTNTIDSTQQHQMRLIFIILNLVMQSWAQITMYRG